MKGLKNTLTNIIAVVLVVAGGVQTYIQTLSAEAEINWLQLVLVVGGAVVAWFTGKSADGKAQ